MSPERPRTIQIQSDSAKETVAIAASIARRLRSGDVLALEGPLGAGKTCFVRGLALGMGIDPAAVSSPTFVIRHEYEAPASGTGGGGGDDGVTLVHIDAYRLRSIDDLESIGWDELLESQDAIIAVEWAGRIADALPGRRIDVAFAHLGESSRDIALSAPAELADRISHLADTAPARCPTCGQEVAHDGETYPFCSKRCRMADLGRWFTGSYQVSRPVEEDDLNR